MAGVWCQVSAVAVAVGTGISGCRRCDDQRLRWCRQLLGGDRRLRWVRLWLELAVAVAVVIGDQRLFPRCD